MVKRLTGVVGVTVVLTFGMAVGAFASTSGNIGIDTGQNVSFHGRYTYGVTPRGWVGKAVRDTGTLASTGSNSGHVNARQQGYSWRRIGHVNIGGKVGVNSDVSPGDTLRAADLRVQVCAEHWYRDHCVERLYRE